MKNHEEDASSKRSKHPIERLRSQHLKPSRRNPNSHDSIGCGSQHWVSHGWFSRISDCKKKFWAWNVEVSNISFGYNDIEYEEYEEWMAKIEWGKNQLSNRGADLVLMCWFLNSINSCSTWAGKHHFCTGSRPTVEAQVCWTNSKAVLFMFTFIIVDCVDSFI